ncbi:MAG: GntR family transcriptional regulator [Eubacteriales bacterium]|jgi:DNA-binding GntR family transcriptional regulator|nr:GntR family transcriptional regulator [Eubacteriales bacterium]
MTQRIKKKSSVVAVQKAYDYIKHSIIEFELRPGSRINEVELAATLDMSRAPVREALNRLVEIGFVTFDSGKGFFCRRFTLAEITDLYEVRFDLETASIKKACEKHDDPAVTALREYWQTIAGSQSSMTIEALISADEDFHLFLANIAGNAERTKLLENIYERIRFVRRINIEKEPRRTNFVKEHLLMIQAVLDNDPEKASELMALHLGANSAELHANIREGLARIYAEDLQ